MDANFVEKRNKEGKVVKELILLPDADKSDVENLSDDENDSVQPDTISDTSSDEEQIDDGQPIYTTNASNIVDEDTFCNKELIKEVILAPYSYFSKFFTDGLLELICTETNNYAIQNNSTFRTHKNVIKLCV